MTGARWQAVRDLFERAVDEAPADVDRWLAAQPGVDSDVRAEAAALWRCHRQADGFLSDEASRRLLAGLSNDALAPGDRVNAYIVERELARGGMGRVYLARDERLNRLVALKAVAPELTEPRERERLRREARAAGALAHPGICTIYALEEVDDAVFIASEYVDGQSLRSEIDLGRLPTPESVDQAARQLADALAHAHERGVLHRDLKPDNVMRTRDGRLKIIDFGLARHDDDPAGTDAHLTQPSTLLGTPAYMAPERLTGGGADARSDLFSLGVLLYEYAAGTHPFSAPSPLTTMARVVDGAAVPLSEQRPEVDAPLAAAVDRLMARVPADRFPSATALLAALDTDAPPAPHGRLARWWRTHHAAVIVLYALASALTWQIKEWQPGLAGVVFLLAGVAATAGTTLRGHLLFLHRQAPAALPGALRRARLPTMGVDLLMAGGLALDGLRLTSLRPLAGLLTIALGVAIALVRFVVEPATESAAFATPTRATTRR